MATRAPKKPSLIEELRRRQIVDTAIRTIATRGFANTTLNDIAEEAGVSTGVITYHFRNKDDLIEQSIRKLFEAPNEYVIGRVDEKSNYREKLRTYIASTIRFNVEHRDHCVALLYSFSSISSQEQRQEVIARHHVKIRRFLEKILREGQAAGEFGRFDAAVIAQIVCGAIEGLLTQWVLDPDTTDLARAAKQLVEMVERQVAAE
jgi:TetR/AcrR family fatty acid metabolism transcriptional regulator